MPNTYTVDVKKTEFVFSPDIPTGGVDTNDIFQFRYADSTATRSVVVLKCDTRSTELLGIDNFNVTSSHTNASPLAQTVSSSIVGDTIYVIKTEQQIGASPDRPMTANIKVVSKV